MSYETEIMEHRIDSHSDSSAVGMAVGSVKNIYLPKEQAYGPRLEENLLKVSREMFPSDRELIIGQKLNIELGGKETRVMRIRNVDEQDVLLDGNHDLAGCDLTFALQLVEIGETAGDNFPSRV